MKNPKSRDIPLLPRCSQSSSLGISVTPPSAFCAFLWLKPLLFLPRSLGTLLSIGSIGPISSPLTNDLVPTPGPLKPTPHMRNLPLQPLHPLHPATHYQPLATPMP